MADAAHKMIEKAQLQERLLALKHWKAQVDYDISRLDKELESAALSSVVLGRDIKKIEERLEELNASISKS